MSDEEEFLLDDELVQVVLFEARESLEEAMRLLKSEVSAGELFHIDERLKYFVNGTHLESGSSYRELEARGLTQLEREFDTAVDRLYELLLDVQRLPVSHVAAPLERALRDICRATGKEIELDTQGRDLRIDKQILQTLRDPLMHMVRNSADHGVEHPSEREKLGKPRLAKITLTFEDLEDLVRVTVRDDGAGIHIEKVKQRALACGLVTQLAVEQLSVQQVIDFIFQPGFSTAQEVSDLSGRGVGMDVVASQIRAAGGRHKTATVQGQGTTFVLELPKPGSPVLDGLAVRRGEMVYIVPMKDILSFIGRPDMRILRRIDGQVLARVGTTHHAVVHAPGDQRSLGLENARTIGVFIEAAPGQRVVMPVDEVLGRRRALIQSVDTFDGPTANGQKACILGDGTMAVALDTSVLVEDPELIFCVDGDSELGLSLEQERERSREAAA